MHVLTATAFWCPFVDTMALTSFSPLYMHIAHQFSSHFQLAIACSNLIVETLEQGVKYIQS